MSFVVDEAVQQRALTHPACLLPVDVRDRPAYGPPDFVAPWAKTCLVVHPVPTDADTNLKVLLFGWEPNGGREDAYCMYVGDWWVHTSLENGVWHIEATFPETRSPPVILGLGSSLVTADSPQAAAQIARLCIPEPISPLKWLPYWGAVSCGMDLSCKDNKLRRTKRGAKGQACPSSNISEKPARASAPLR